MSSLSLYSAKDFSFHFFLLLFHCIFNVRNLGILGILYNVRANKALNFQRFSLSFSGGAIKNEDFYFIFSSSAPEVGAC